jgi:signal transduction histidine kinase
MKLVEFILDLKGTILTMFLLLLFVNLTILVDPKLHLSPDNLVYLNSTYIVMILFYLLLTYFIKRNQLNRLKMENHLYVDSLIPKSNEQKVYFEIIRKNNEHYLNQIRTLKQEQKEQLEYMTNWFHEIKTPIAVSRLLLETEVKSPSMIEEMDKIEHFVEQALYFSRLNEFHKDYLIQEVDIERLVKDVLKNDAILFINKKIRLNLHLNKLDVLSDKKGLMYIIRQILVNAMKYSEVNGELIIEIDVKNHQLIIRDHGIGIPTEDLDRVFEKGFTGINGRRQKNSTGMGLYLSKKMASKLGHELTITSKPECFTEVVIHFKALEDRFYKL